MLIWVKLSKLLFDPIAITAALGGVILLRQLWRAHRHYVFAVTLYGLCFMLGWRSLCGTGSSRYSAVLILLGIVLSVYCIFNQRMVAEAISASPVDHLLGIAAAPGGRVF